MRLNKKVKSTPVWAILLIVAITVCNVGYAIYQYLLSVPAVVIIVPLSTSIGLQLYADATATIPVSTLGFGVIPQSCNVTSDSFYLKNTGILNFATLSISAVDTNNNPINWGKISWNIGNSSLAAGAIMPISITITVNADAQPIQQNFKINIVGVG